MGAQTNNLLEAWCPGCAARSGLQTSTGNDTQSSVAQRKWGPYCTGAEQSRISSRHVVGCRGGDGACTDPKASLFCSRHRCGITLSTSHGSQANACSKLWTRRTSEGSKPWSSK